MSQTIEDGQQFTMDPNDQRVITFDWDDENLGSGVTIITSVWTITGVRQADVLADLTSDNDSIVSASRKTQVRLLATTATAGDYYEVANKITTNESPAQQKERSCFVLIENA